MAIFRGLNVFLYLGDVDNLAESLTNLGLNINDLNKIRGLADSIDSAELHLLGNLNDDQEKETYAAYRSGFEVSNNIASLTDIYSNTYDSNLIVNSQVRASAIKYNFIQYSETPPNYYEVKQADISTSRVSSWSSLNTDTSNTIFYGAEVAINPLSEGAYADPDDSYIFTQSLKFLGPITEKRFSAEEPTTQVELTINGTTYYFYTMKNIPLSFDTFFRSSLIEFSVTAGTQPTLVILDNQFDPPAEFVYQSLADTTTQEFNFTTSGSKRLDFYARPDTFLFFNLTALNISSFPKATLPNLRDLDLTQNNFTEIPQDPPFSTRLPALRNFVFAGNPLSTAQFSGNVQINSLPQGNTSPLEFIDISGTFSDSGAIDLSGFSNLRRFYFNSSWSRGNIRRNTFSGETPDVGQKLLEISLRDQSYRTLSSTMFDASANNELQKIDVFNNSIRNMTGDVDPQIINGIPRQINITEVNLNENTVRPVCFGAPTPGNNAIDSEASQNLITYRHNKNFNAASVNIGEATFFGSNTHGYFEGCKTLRFVDFSDSYVTGDFTKAFYECTNMEDLNLTNTRINGTFQELALYAKIIIDNEGLSNVFNEEYNQALRALFSQLGTFSLSGGTFDTTVDTANNFFGNDLQQIITDFGEALYNTNFWVNELQNRVNINQFLNPTSGDFWMDTTVGVTPDTYQITATDFINNIPGLNSGNDGPFTFVTGHAKGNIITNANQGRYAICQLEADYIADARNGGFIPSNGWNYTIEGAVGLYDAEGVFEAELRPNDNEPELTIPYRGELGAFRSRQANHTGFGESVAINDDYIFVGIPGAFQTRFVQAGAVAVFNWAGVPQPPGRLQRPIANDPEATTRFGSQIIADNTFIWVADDADRRIFKFRNARGFDLRGTPFTSGDLDELNIQPFTERPLGQMKQNENYVLVGGTGRTRSGNTLKGAVWAINKNSDDLIRILPGALDAPDQDAYERNFATDYDIVSLPDGNTVIAVTSPTETFDGSTVELYNIDGTLIDSLGYHTGGASTAASTTGLYVNKLNFHTYRQTEGASFTTVLTLERTLPDALGNNLAHINGYIVTSAGFGTTTQNLQSAANYDGDIFQFDGSEPVFEDFEVPNSSKAFRMLPALDSFTVGGTKSIEGKMPDMQYFNVLRTLNLDSTNLSGEVDFNQLNEAVTIKIPNNRFNGRFPDTDLNELQILDISQNQFTALGELGTPKLEFFDCSSNEIGGIIPDFTSSPLIKDANLSTNRFASYESDTFSTCLNIRKLDLSNNQLTLQDAFRVLDDMETNYQNNNRGGVTINLLGNSSISEVLINQNSTYFAKLAYLRTIAGWIVLLN